MKEQIAQQCRDAVAELYEVAHLKAGDILVVGCSTSEVLGSKTAVEIFNSLYGFLKEKGVYLAAQCCEHLNRAIIVEAEAVPNADIVNVVPQPKAGGSFATAAYHGLEHPVAVEEIKADAGLDIGATLIGMHLKKVAVPVRLQVKQIGQAPLTAARVRPKFIGGVRAVYDQTML